ncbi:MAG: hypothetical protein ABF679_06410 [Lentilactobacillus diolivorans]|jgi:hypothetical protein|uniref:Uncharacterized protein n=2 Tax=Lentilactobacillus diolivorans TaxID=179838 RepID=A0A0R1SRK0_9LACO|nr:hypothetical protein [Lentilactobacillus diolivorans]RRG01024.1 MAG: hypothetical protein DUD34_13510 [Lactobacillus sp.]KRL69322.1 hypothetical protein FC85_GL001486 [Lentilactobacillus diolivorans DSM 14421]MCH4164815.1 hypothetical protein [Lentilactobacillus diolivorans]MDH5104476.1 hypothetical protein [Lentilactobacillus diolivorans]GEP24732.1 hypothetical protein LDI01_23250 [Lentilactobacillus diolivorans]
MAEKAKESAEEKKADAEEKPESKFNFSSDEVKKAVDLIEEKGYITKIDFKEMDDDDWAKGFSKEIDKVFQKSDEDPYIYYEKFDFVGGDIDSIIWNMDVIKTREGALEKLADVLKKRIK